MHIKPIYILTTILALAAIYFYQDPEWNGNTRLDAVRAFVEQGKFSIDAYLEQPDWATGDKAFYNGHYYTDKAIGSSLFAAIPYFFIYKLTSALGITLKSNVIKHLLTTLVMGTSFTVNGLAMYQIALLISHNPWKAFIGTAGVAFGTLLWPYSAVFFGHVPAATFLCVAFCLLFSIRESTGGINIRWFFFAGLSLGFAFITDYTTAPIIAGLLVYAIYVLRKQSFSDIVRCGIAGALGALIALSFMFVYNALVYGTPFTFGYAHQFSFSTQQPGSVSDTLGTQPDLAVLYHITLDPKFGIFWQSPILALALLGYVVALKTTTFRPEGLISLFAVASILLINSAIIPWWGGHAFGPRYLIVALPFFIVPVALLPDSLKWLTGLMGVFSALQMVIPLMGQVQIPLDYKWGSKQLWVEGNYFQGFSLLFNYCLPLFFRLFQKGKMPWTLGYAIRFLPYRLYLSLPLLIGVEALLISLFYKISRTTNKTELLQPMESH